MSSDPALRAAVEAREEAAKQLRGQGAWEAAKLTSLREEIAGLVPQAFEAWAAQGYPGSVPVRCTRWEKRFGRRAQRVQVGDEVGGVIVAKWSENEVNGNIKIALVSPGQLHSVVLGPYNPALRTVDYYMADLEAGDPLANRFEVRLTTVRLALLELVLA